MKSPSLPIPGVPLLIQPEKGPGAREGGWAQLLNVPGVPRPHLLCHPSSRPTNNKTLATITLTSV